MMLVCCATGCAAILGIGDLPGLPEGAEGTEGGMDDAALPDTGAGPSDASGASDAPPTPGSGCPNVGETRTKPCGICGEQTSTCEKLGNGDLAWSEYGPCANELPGGCTPDEVLGQEACGNCGTSTTRCGSACAPVQGPCMGQPVNSCEAGAVEYSTAGCATNLRRHRTCSETCMWSNFSATCE